MKARSLILVLTAIATLLVVTLWPTRPQPPTSPPATKPIQTKSTARQTTNTSAPKLGFEIARETNLHRWAADDGRDTNVIRRLAHNDLEYQRLVEENARILRRQLVQRAEPAAVAIERAKLTGEKITRLTLPGLDGREIEFEIKHSDLAPSGLQGSFSGIVAGQPDSMVTLAFKNRREAFTVLSPADGLYLQGHPHDPGEIIVTSFDPEAYTPLPGGEPIRTAEQLQPFR